MVAAALFERDELGDNLLVQAIRMKAPASVIQGMITLSRTSTEDIFETAFEEIDEVMVRSDRTALRMAVINTDGVEKAFDVLKVRQANERRRRRRNRSRNERAHPQQRFCGDACLPPLFPRVAPQTPTRFLGDAFLLPLFPPPPYVHPCVAPPLFTRVCVAQILVKEKPSHIVEPYDGVSAIMTSKDSATMIERWPDVKALFMTEECPATLVLLTQLVKLYKLHNFRDIAIICGESAALSEKEKYAQNFPLHQVRRGSGARTTIVLFKATGELKQSLLASGRLFPCSHRICGASFLRSHRVCGVFVAGGRR